MRDQTFRAPEEQVDWSAWTKGQIAAVRELIGRHHAGPVNSKDPGFKSKLSAAMEEAERDSERVRSMVDGYFLLRKAILKLQDGHTYLSWSDRNTMIEMIQPRWPGFSLRYAPAPDRFSGRFVVNSVRPRDDGALNPQFGWELAGCDGTPALELFRNRVVPYYVVSSSEGEWVQHGFRLMVDYGNSWLSLLNECEFVDPVSATRAKIPLSWQPVTFEMLNVYASGTVKNRVFETHEFAPKRTWISVPHFGPALTEEERDGLDLSARLLPTALRGEAVVFDLRGNSGGDSQWIDRLLSKVYSREELERLTQGLYGTAMYRVSRQNLSHWRSVVERQRRDFGDSSHFSKVVETMETAIEIGEELVPVSANSLGAGSLSKSATPRAAHAARVFALVDGYCTSSCLTMVDIVRRVFGAQVIGQPTSADSVYIDMREERLPGERMTLYMSLKVYPRRQRGNNEAYWPSGRDFYDGDMSDTAALEQWVLRRSK